MRRRVARIRPPYRDACRCSQTLQPLLRAARIDNETRPIGGMIGSNSLRAFLHATPSSARRDAGFCAARAPFATRGKARSVRDHVEASRSSISHRFVVFRDFRHHDVMHG